MKTLTFLAAATATLIAAAPARAREPIPPANHGGWTGAPTDCPLIIGFSSYGAGIDGPTLVRVERLLNSDRGVRRITRHPWGREGEVTLCARTRSLQDAFRLSRQIRAMIPARPRGPVQVNTLRTHRR